MLDSYIKQGIDEATTLLLEKVKAQTPEDTGELQSNNKKQPTINIGGIMRGGLVNETSYGAYVEYGVNGKAYNYYKNGGRKGGGSPFYRGIGARMFTKSQFENQSKVRDIIMKYINQGIKDFNSKKK